jgi:hypothetical protein
VLAAMIAAFTCYLSLLSFYAEQPKLYPLTLLVVLAACVATSGVTYVDVPYSIVTLARGLAITTGIYSVSLFPSFPTLNVVFDLSRELVRHARREQRLFRSCLSRGTHPIAVHGLWVLLLSVGTYELRLAARQLFPDVDEWRNVFTVGLQKVSQVQI